VSALTDSEQLKALQVRATKAGQEVNAIRAEMQDVNVRLATAKARLDSINGEIAKLREAAVDPIVSEHALLRYAERVMGLDLAEVRAKILTPRNVAAINFVRNGKVPAGDGMTLIVRDRSVVSVITNEEATA
jgi:chromosome segregation ATPase